MEVVDGLYRGSAPSPNDVKMLKDKYGINKIISLDESAGEAISRTCKLLGIKQVKIYISYRQGLLNLFSHNLKDLLLKDGPTYVHCIHGKDRTSLVIALFECKYLGESPEEAIHEAKKIGFGIGLAPEVTNLYEKLIRACKPAQDENNADIVSNQREFISDNRDSYLGGVEQGSFAPYLDPSRRDTVDFVYNPVNDQSMTRQNYQDGISINDDPSVDQSGIFDNDAGLQGLGPTINMSGFIYD